MSSLSAVELTHRYALINGIRMHYVEAGSGEPVVLLHGFPEMWYSWRHQIVALAPHYRVIVPDQRGYNETESQAPFDTGTLQEDVVALLHHIGEGRAHIIGHDWGAAIAWLLAIEHPEVVRSLAICNVPHPAVFRKKVLSPRQLVRSWYILFFQLPGLPEWTLSARNYQVLARDMIRQCRQGTFTPDDVRTFLESWRTHGLGGGINWYRAALRSPRPLPQPVPRITVPTTVIWGENDRYLGKDLVDGTSEYVGNLEIHMLPGISHWVQQEEPEAVNSLLLNHLWRAGA